MLHAPTATSSKGVHQQAYQQASQRTLHLTHQWAWQQAHLHANHQTHQLAYWFVQTRMPSEAASCTTLQCCNTNQYNPLTQGPEHKWQQQQPELHPLLWAHVHGHAIQVYHRQHVGLAMLWQLCDRNSIFTWCITQLENEVHQAMSVMDKDTGKLLNYRQLMSSPKYRNAWSLSSANIFGQLANSIRGWIKNLTNTIEFIFQHEVLADTWKMSHTGRLFAWSDQKRQNPIKWDSQYYPGNVATPTKEMLVAKCSSTVISTQRVHISRQWTSPTSTPWHICISLNSFKLN